MEFVAVACAFERGLKSIDSLHKNLLCWVHFVVGLLG